MTKDPQGRPWRTLDKDLKRISQMEYATAYVSRPLIGLGIALAFIVLAGLVSVILLGQFPVNMVVVSAAVFGAYMAINIGANDVANNMGPAVGAKALTMGGAILIAFAILVAANFWGQYRLTNQIIDKEVTNSVRQNHALLQLLELQNIKMVLLKR